MAVSRSPFSKVTAVADQLWRDIYTGNILLRVPELDTLSPEKIIVQFGYWPAGWETLRKAFVWFAPSSLLTFSFCEVQLIDFGECKPLIQSRLCKTIC